MMFQIKSNQILHHHFLTPKYLELAKAGAAECGGYKSLANRKYMKLHALITMTEVVDELVLYNAWHCKRLKYIL